jgi:HemY protein
MIRVIVFLAVLLGLAVGLSWIADRPGSVVITWLGQRVELEILPAIIGFLAATIALAVLWSLVRLVFRLPGIMSLSGRNRRKQKGYAAVSRGMVAVGAGDSKTAIKQAAEAQRLLGAEPLTLLLNAQSAQLSGDGAKAEKAFNLMLDNRDTRVVGLRGLSMEANRKNDGKAARFYADEAFKLAPSADWASDAALSNRCQDRDWLGAMAMVEQAASRRLIDKDTARKHRAILLTADAIDRSAREPDAAMRSAQEAVKLDPMLVPAAAIVGRKISEKGDYSKASKILEASWAASPHPDLADAYLDVRLGDSAQDRLKRARSLQKLAPRDGESRLTVARAALDAREFATARENLEALVLEHPTVRACVLMAELEELESGNMGLVREWLARASRAERDKAWVADGRVSETWGPVSPVTGKLGGFVWTTPPQAPGSMLLEEMSEKRSMPVVLEAPPVNSVSEPIVSADITPAVVKPAITPLTAPDDPGLETAEPKKKWRLFG